MSDAATTAPQVTHADYDAAFHARMLQRLVAAACTSFLDQAPDRTKAGLMLTTLLASAALDCARETTASLHLAEERFLVACCEVAGVTLPASNRERLN